MTEENLTEKPKPIYRANKRLVFIENERQLMHILIFPITYSNYNLYSLIMYRDMFHVIYFGVEQQIWKNFVNSANPTFLDPNNPHWGWTWLEHWMAIRQWEIKSMTDNNSMRGDTIAGSHLYIFLVFPTV